MNTTVSVTTPGTPRIQALAAERQYQQAICSHVTVSTMAENDPVDPSFPEAGQGWGLQGIRAYATVYLVHAPDLYQELTVCSPGFWSADLPTDPQVWQRIADDQLSILWTLLAQLNVWIPDTVTIVRLPKMPEGVLV